MAERQQPTDKLYWFPNVPSEWRKHTGHLSPEARGAYRELCDAAWEATSHGRPPCTLPDDDAQLGRLSGWGATRFKRFAGEVRKLYEKTSEGQLFDFWLYDIWIGQQKKHAEAVKKAKKAVDAREAKRRRIKVVREATPQKQLDLQDDLGDKRNSAGLGDLQDHLEIIQSESDTAVEPSLQRVLPAVAADAAAPDGARSHGPEGPLAGAGAKGTRNGADPVPLLDALAPELEKHFPGKLAATRKRQAATAQRDVSEREVELSAAWLADRPGERQRVDDELQRELQDLPIANRQARRRMRSTIAVRLWRDAGAPDPELARRESG